MGRRLAGRRLAVFLWLVGLPLPAAAARLHRLQLRLRHLAWAGTHPPPQGPVDRGHRRQPGHARLLQVCGFLRCQPGAIAGATDARPARGAADRDLVFYVHADCLPGRYLPGQGAGKPLCPLSAVRHVFSAPDRRPCAAPQGDDAAVRRQADLPALGQECGHRLDDFHHRAGEKSTGRR
ncbi:hypothetical protein D3C81_1066780 [compost metagenome]